MLKDITNVVKTRWPEIVLIAGFLAISWFLLEQLMISVPSETIPASTEAPAYMSETTMFLFSMMSMIFFVISTTLYLGFLATLNVNPTASHTPGTLVTIGRIFFWRVFRFEFFLSLYHYALTYLIYAPMKFVLHSYKTPENMLEWAFNISSIIAAAVLIKPMLLIPPIMIFRNLMVLPAIKKMGDYRISDIKILPVILIGFLLLLLSITALQKIFLKDTVILNVIFAFRAILSSIAALLTGIIGIWFIAGKRFGALHQPEDEDTEEISQ